MGSSTMDNFVVGSNGHCFFCLERVLTIKPNWNSESPPISIHSLQLFSTYLKMDMKKVFNDEDHVPPELLGKIKKSRLKAELCGECVSLSARFSELYQRLEKLRIEMESCLELIQGKFRSADNAGKMEQIYKLTESRIADSNMAGLLEILSSLRAESNAKISQKIIGRPIVKIQNLTSEDIKRKRNNMRKNIPLIRNEGETSMSTSNSTFTKATNIKTNLEISNQEFSPAEDDINQFSDDSDLHSEAAISKEKTDSEHKKITKLSKCGVEVVVKGERGVAAFPSRSSNSVKTPKRSINPETGKVKCNICNMDFNSQGSFDHHYNTVHLKRRYKCVLCNKLFTSKGSLGLHQRTTSCGSGMGITPKFECRICGEAFKRKDYLQTHVDGIHLQIEKYGCEICDQKFKTKQSLASHRRKAHGMRKNNFNK